ncbi:MAG TPA: hypothetical protein VI503_06455 [Gaiellaceae bacterium]|nr:hypothetical protein [Gaiellaceae bacterium]
MHRFELFNRTQLFGWVADGACPAWRRATSIASSTSTGGRRSSPAPRDEQAFVDHLRSSRPVYLARLEDGAARAAA